jgi:hypothetical protein
MMVRWLLGMKNNHSKSGTSTLRLLTTILHSDGDLTEQGKIRYVITVSRYLDCIVFNSWYNCYMLEFLFKKTVSTSLSVFICVYCNMVLYGGYDKISHVSDSSAI